MPPPDYREVRGESAREREREEEEGTRGGDGEKEVLEGRNPSRSGLALFFFLPLRPLPFPSPGG